MRSRKSIPRPSHGQSRRHRFHASLEWMESRQLLSTFLVTNTADSGAGSLRQAITMSNLPHSGADNIDFDIPASMSPTLDAPVPGFDPATQTWKISLASPLPTLNHQVTIDGYTQAQTGVPFVYPNAITQNLTIVGSPTGGTFTLTTSSPLPVGTTAPIPYNANSAQVLAALNGIVGAGNVFVSGGPSLPDNTITISFIGQYAGVSVPTLIATSSLTGGSGTQISVTKVAGTPTEIVSTPNGDPISAAIQGNDATPRVIIDGSGIGGASTGFQLNTSQSIVRGLIIDGFGTGVSVPNPGTLGDLIQGDAIGQYRVNFVDPATGVALTGANQFGIAGQGNSVGVVLGSTNATVGGLEPQDNNVILGNKLQGVSILAGAHGNQVVGNQIGIVGPPAMGGVYFIVPNGSDGVLIADSSNYVGGVAAGSGNLISGNDGDGVHIVGPAATRNNVQGNYIGVAPAGGFLFGSGDPGNLGDGVTIDNASDNDIGGASVAARNVISASGGAGVRISGASGLRNMVQGNYIGITADGISALGNSQEGVAISSADNVVGPSNVISANLRGVLLSGAGATGNLVQGNLIGTNAAGTADLGNSQEGIRIDGAPLNTISGNAQGSQVISGNNVGLLIIGAGSAGTQVLGNFIGTDLTGTLDLGNSQEGVLIANSPNNTIGGTTITSVNLISANHSGLVITGSPSTGNVVQGNLIGTDVSGKLSLGNELDGVYINSGASSNLIGGSSAAAGNTIAFNRRDGVRIEDASLNNGILTNGIFANLELGINLVPSVSPGPNNLQSAPTLMSIATGVGSTIVTGTLSSPTNGTYTIQFFLNTQTSPPGPIQGQQYVGQTTVTVTNGITHFSASVPVILRSGQLITATATDPLGNTSEFSAAAPPRSSAPSSSR